MKIDSPTSDTVPQLRALWRDAFGDSDAFLDSFFFSAYSPARCRCLTLDGQVAAALYWFETSCDGAPMAYLYAVATAPAHRNRGLCHALMADTHRYLQARGYAAALLVPDGETLSRFYGAMGYRPCTTITQFSAAPGGDPIPLAQIDAETYARLRRTLLPPGSVIQESESLSFLETQATLYAGENLIFAARRDGDALFVPELLGDTGAAPGILAALGCARGTFRTPGSGVPFAMYLPLSPDTPAPAYFGLAFD